MSDQICIQICVCWRLKFLNWVPLFIRSICAWMFKTRNKRKWDNQAKLQVEYMVAIFYAYYLFDVQLQCHWVSRVWATCSAVQMWDVPTVSANAHPASALIPATSTVCKESRCSVATVQAVLSADVSSLSSSQLTLMMNDQLIFYLGCIDKLYAFTCAWHKMIILDF